MTKLIASASIATLTLMLATPAFAQDPAATQTTPPETATTAPEEVAVGEVIVTAQKRSERLQDVPVAVSVVGGAALESMGKVSVEGAKDLVPALNFLKSGTTLNQSIFLRGVGTATFSIAGEPSVSTVVDGVVFSRSGEAFGDLVDVDRMEVLRGPQGTLFGKNASAGVINIVSKQPTAEVGGYAEAGYFFGAGTEYRVRGAINLPLSDTVRTRLSGFGTDYDGNVRNNAYGGARVNGFNHVGGRFQLVADVTPAVKLALIADYHRNRDDCCADIIATGVPVVSGTTVTGFATTNPVFTALPTPRGDKTRRVNQDLVTATRETGYGLSGQLDWDFGPAALTSITAYRNYKNTEVRDGDWLDRAYIGFNQLHDFGPQTGNTFSQEVRLTSPGKQFIDYVVGAYYSRAKSERIFSRFDQVCAAAATPAPTTLTPCSSPLAAASTFPSATADFGSVFKNLAFFGQATVNVTDVLRVIGGLRYTDDKLGVFHSRVATGLTFDSAGRPNSAPGIQPNFDSGVYTEYLRLLAINPTLATPLTIDQLQRAAALRSNGVPFRAKTSNDNWSGKAGIQYDFSRQVMAYATYARGYKGPAYNIFFNLAGSGTNVIEPETSDAYEIGLKNTLFGGRLVLNLAAYYAKYKNFQANNPDLVAGVVVTRFTNAGTVSTRGGELDLIWRPARDLSLSGGLAYTDAHVNRFNAALGAPATAIIPTGTPLGFAPKWKGNLGIDYRWRTTGPIDVFAGAQGSFQSKQLSLFAPDPVQRALGTIDGYGTVNLSAGITASDDKWRLTAQVRNLFDNSFAAAIINGGPSGSYRYQIPRDADRYYGVTARLNF